MTQQPRIPDAETRQRHHQRIREVCRRFDATNLKFDEIIAGLDAHIREQKRQRLTRASNNQPIAPDSQ